MASVIKVLSSEIATSTTANTVNNAKLVRVHATANTVVTVANSSAGVLGTLSVFGGTDVFVEKQPTDTIATDVAAKAVSVAFRN